MYPMKTNVGVLYSGW